MVHVYVTNPTSLSHSQLPVLWRAGQGHHHRSALVPRVGAVAGCAAAAAAGQVSMSAVGAGRTPRWAWRNRSWAGCLHRSRWQQWTGCATAAALPSCEPQPWGRPLREDPAVQLPVCSVSTRSSWLPREPELGSDSRRRWEEMGSARRHGHLPQGVRTWFRED